MRSRAALSVFPTTISWRSGDGNSRPNLSDRQPNASTSARRGVIAGAQRMRAIITCTLRTGQLPARATSPPRWPASRRRRRRSAPSAPTCRPRSTTSSTGAWRVTPRTGSHRRARCAPPLPPCAPTLEGPFRGRPPHHPPFPGPARRPARPKRAGPRRGAAAG